MADEMSVESFWDILQKSGLLSEERFRQLMVELRGGASKLRSSHDLADELTRRGVLTEWQANMLLRGKYRGFHLGPYRILGILGWCGMSNMFDFLAEHELIGRRCAILILSRKYDEDAEMLSRFRREASAVAGIDHPNIIRFYDFNKDVRYGKGQYYLVTEYFDGRNLRQLVEEHGPLDCRKAADLTCQAAEGLAHAHKTGFIHRDVTPAHLLVDPNGQLKLLCLTLTQSVREDQACTVRTADYVAPEQVMGSRDVDGRADIYSLGLTLYFLLTGCRPFPKATLVELFMAHRNEQPEPISSLRPDVPQELVEIVERMTAKPPMMRFQTAKDVVVALRSWLDKSADDNDDLVPC